MIELEIQGLSASREGLLIDVGRAIVASGFTLQRQRLTQDVNGVLLTMVVRGPERKQRALEAALDANERLLSFQTHPFEDGSPTPHYAAARTFARPPVAPAPAPVVTAVAAAPAASLKPATAAACAIAATVAMESATPNVSRAAFASTQAAPSGNATVASLFAEAPVLPSVPERVTPEAPIVDMATAIQTPLPEPEEEPEFVFIVPRPSSPAPAAVIADPYVEVVPLAPDEDAVEKAMAALISSYPQIFPCLHALQASVTPGARESSLQSAGRRTGAWVSERNNRPGEKLSLDEAMQRVAIPALGALAQVDYSGGQLHIRNHALCKESGRSSCQFYIGYLEGLLSPMLISGNLSTFPLGCCSYGGDACVIAISE